ncbi:hypothetical protein D9M69_473150 [compost metagenome]
MLVERGGGGPALADVQPAPGLYAAQGRIGALDLAARKEALATVRADALQVHQLAAVVQRDQQEVAVLAQGVGASLLGHQVGMPRIGAAGIAPETVGVFGGALLTLTPLRFPLPASLLDALTHLLGLDRVRRLPAAPGVRTAGLPTAEATGGDAIGEQHVPAVVGTGAVARDVEAVDVAVSNGQPVQLAEHPLQSLPEDQFHFLQAERGHRRDGAVFHGHGVTPWPSSGRHWPA